MINYPDNIRVYDNFLPDNIAQKAYSQLSSIPQQWFSLRRTQHESNQDSPKGTRTWWSIHGHKGENARLDSQGKTTYQFMATDNHQIGCDCLYCDLLKIFNTNQPPEVSDKQISQSFLSVFRPGDFLSQHTDSQTDCSWAFTYTLSTGWRPEWGGILNIQDSTHGDWYAFPPVFNRLIMMDMTTIDKSNHFVSKVAEDCPVNRITLSGWYNN